MQYVVTTLYVGIDGDLTVGMVYGPFDQQAAAAAYKVVRAEYGEDVKIVVRGLFEIAPDRVDAERVTAV